MWGAIAAAAAPIVTGIIGNHISSGDRGNAEASAQAALQALMSAGYPPDTSKALVLEQFKQAGILTPEAEQSIMMGPSKVAGITEDPALRDSQMSALELLSQRATGGLNPEDRAKLNEIRNQLATEQNAKQQQIVQQFQMRGMGGSGAELAAALSSSQAGANQASQEGDRLAAMASQNALEAATRSGQLGGQVRSQDFDVNKTRSSAEDEMNRFNIQNQVAQQQRNVAARNRSGELNLGNQQDVMNKNTGMYNTELNRQNEARATDWRNKMDYAATLAGGHRSEQKRFEDRGQQTRDQYGAIGGGLGSAFGKGFGGQSAPAGGAKVQMDQGYAPEQAEYDPRRRYLDSGKQYAMYDGGMVPGEPKYPGNHPENDTVDAKLSPGEIVLPKVITESDNAPLHAANYVDILKKIYNEKNGRK